VLDRPEQVAGWHGAVDTVVGVGAVDLVGKSGLRFRLPHVYYAPTARKQLLSEGQLLIEDDLIPTYNRNSHEVDKFGLESSDGYFQMDGKIIDYLFYVFEARTSHEAYAITRSEARHQRDDDDVGKYLRSQSGAGILLAYDLHLHHHLKSSLRRLRRLRYR
jgi:hypothetical protein